MFGFKDLQIDNLVKEMNELERVAAEGGSPKIERSKTLNAEFWQQIRLKESLLAQNSRAKWIAEGEDSC